MGQGTTETKAPAKPAPTGNSRARKAVLWGLILLVISVFMFTFGALVGRQLMLAEVQKRSPKAEEVITEEPTEEVEDHEVEIATEKAETEGIATPEEKPTAANTEGTEQAAPETDAEDKKVEPKEEAAAKPQEDKSITELKTKGHTKAEQPKVIPPQVAKLFDGPPVTAGTGAKLGKGARKPSAADAATAKKLNWTLQVGSYPTEVDAKGKISELKAKGVGSAYYEETLVKGATWYRVGVGRYATPTDAQAEGKRLQQLGSIANYFTRKVDK